MPRDWVDERRDFLIYVVGRPLMFIFWSLVAWGTLYAALFTYCGITQGLATAWVQARSGRDALGGVVNVGLALWALLVWSAVIAIVWRTRRARRLRSVVRNTPE